MFQQTQSQWQTVFYIAAAIDATGCVFYVVFGKGETQDWVRPYLGEDKPSREDEKPQKMALLQPESAESERERKDTIKV